MSRYASAFAGRPTCRRTRSAALSTVVTAASAATRRTVLTETAAQRRDLLPRVAGPSQDLNLVSLEHLDHPFPRRRLNLRRLSGPVGLPGGGQNFRKGGGQNFRNPQVVILPKPAWKSILITIRRSSRHRHRRTPASSPGGSRRTGEADRDVDPLVGKHSAHVHPKCAVQAPPAGPAARSLRKSERNCAFTRHASCSSHRGVGGSTPIARLPTPALQRPAG
jgi:hypothetical protein